MARPADPSADTADSMRLRARAWCASPWPALVVDADDRAVEASDAARTLFAFRPPRPLQGLTSGEALARMVARVRRSGSPVHDAAMVTPGQDGAREPASAEVTASPLDDDAVLLTLRPISAEEGARHSVEGLSAAAGMGRTLAHEVKNPLAGIRGAAQLLASGATGENAELAKLIVDETERIRRLIDRVEALSDARPSARRRVNLHAVLDRVRRLVASGAGPPVRFRERYDPSLPDAEGDEDQLVQVVLNLVKNAAEAAGRPGAPGEVTLATAWRQGGRTPLADGAGWRATPLELRVEDDGPGVDPALRARLFDPFVTSKPTGEGLGLTLAAKLVADHGGSLDFTSEPKRTVFRLLLPAAPDMEPAA